MLVLDVLFLVGLGVLAGIAWILERAGRDADEAGPGRGVAAR